MENQYLVQPETQKDTKKLWHLFGNTYDLTTFLDKHPGGNQILKVTQGHLDVTPMFESYHAFADMDKIRADMEKYKVGKSEYPEHYTFKKGDFYDTVRERVRKHFGKGKNVNDKVKLNNFWFQKVLIIALLFFFNGIWAFFKADIGTLQSCFHASLAGFFLMSLAFCIFHDATHFALYSRNFEKNDVLAKITGALIMWNSELWMMHHSFRHHTYTGDAKLDPDVLNYHPFIRKTDRVDRKKYLKFPYNMLPYITTFVLMIFPGQWMGQVLVYWVQWQRKGHLWRMSYPSQIMNRKMYENMILFFVIFMHFYKMNIWVSLSYIITLNISYALAIIPDHDTNETHNNFDDSRLDWGETQVRNSGNFGNNQWGDIYNHLFGGINYQIEHHLFPSMCGVHLNSISPIVQETCKEFDIPYVSHKGVLFAYVDFLKGVKNLYSKEMKSKYA